MSDINPRNWRYTFEAQSHIPLLKLFLFTPQINPINHCNNLTVNLIFEKSLINITWSNQNQPNLINLIVPLPRVLVDLESSLIFRTLDDHIEVKIPLLLPVDHPIVSGFISDLNDVGDGDGGVSSGRFLEPLSVDSDFNALSAKGEVDFYCRNCSAKLTKRSVRCLVDLPSVNWTDVADNWFGGCCSTYGGASEKLVAKYVKSYRCAEGTCLLTTASVILCKDDVTGFKSPEIPHQLKKRDDKGILDIKFSSNGGVGRSECDFTESPLSHDFSTKPVSMHLETKGDSVKGESAECDGNFKDKPFCSPSGIDHVENFDSEHHCCTHDAPESCSKDQELSGPAGLQAEQKSFLNCYLGDAFLFRSSGISKDIEWINFSCPQCSCVLGAYPCSDGSEPLDGGIRMLKCYISLTPTKLTYDLFSKYTLERMFTSQLLESAKDELSFRTVVKDLKTKSSILHLVLVNPNLWCYSGLVSEDTPEHVKINLHPVIKVLVSQCSENVKSELRTNQEWESKNQVDEFFMPTHIIEELVKSMEKAKHSFPSSFSSTQGLLLSYILR